MPIAQERLIEALRASEELLAAIGKVEEIIEREARLARENLITSQEALSNLEVLLTAEGLVENLNEIKLVIEKERLRLTPARIKANAQRAAQRRHEREARRGRGRESESDGEFEL